VKRLPIITISAIIIGLIGIGLATLIDDPEHIVNPDPDCPICQAYKTQVLLTVYVDLASPSILLLYLNEPQPNDLYSESHRPLLSIRAPPLF